MNNLLSVCRKTYYAPSDEGAAGRILLQGIPDKSQGRDNVTLQLQSLCAQMCFIVSLQKRLALIGGTRH